MFRRYRIVFRIFFFSFFLWIQISPLSILADPVWGERIILSQPDGTPVEAFIFGDEFHVRIESKEGYTLIRNPDTGTIEYAVLLDRRLVPSGWGVGSIPPVDLDQIRFPKHLSDRIYRIAEIRRQNPLDLHDGPTLALERGINVQAVTGTKKAFMVCVQFKSEDSPPNQWSAGTYSPANFHTRLFDSGTSSISLTNFYRAQSYGMFWPEGYTYPQWLTLPSTASEYKEDGSWATVIGDALDAIRTSDPSFDFFVHSNDGDMDIIVIWAGTRETWGTFFWPKMGGAYLTKYGIRVRYYNVVNERHSTGDENTSISTFCHEYGHMIGAPDLYDYDDFQNKPMGHYCIMGRSDYRLGFSGYIKSHEYGWIDPIEIVNGGDFQVDALGMAQAVNPRMYKIYIEYPLEYLLLENRFNGSHPHYENAPDRRSGLLITHVDENFPPADGWPYYTFYGVEAVCPDMNPQFTTLAQYSRCWNKMVWGADFGHTQIGPSYPDNMPAGSFIRLSSIDDEENVIYRNTQGHNVGSDIHIIDIGTSGSTMNFSVLKITYVLTLIASPGGTTVPSPGSHTYDKGRRVDLTVLEDPYYTFTEWTGDVSSIQPTMSFISILMDSNKALTAHFKKIHKPLEFKGEQVLNRSLAQAEYINILTWAPNPLNSGHYLRKYVIYLQVDNQWQYLAEVDATAHEYWQRNVDKDKTYRLKVVAKNDRAREGEPAFYTIGK